MESKRERFIRLAEARTNKIIKMIELLGNLSNRSAYDYNEHDINRIYERIYNELDVSKARFGFGLRSKAEAFSLEKNITEEVIGEIQDPKGEDLIENNLSKI